MTPNAYAFIALTAMVGAVAATLTFAFLRFTAAALDSRHMRGGPGGEKALISAALQEAVAKLKAQERATAARAEASERLSSEIITSLTAGLLVVGLTGEVHILNPAGRRMLTVPDPAPFDDYRRLLREPALSELIDRCLRTRDPILRRVVHLPE